jgi:peptidoglycan/xylan/chitin deacetylase (PgdA/CDA1 family)
MADGPHRLKTIAWIPDRRCAAGARPELLFLAFANSYCDDSRRNHARMSIRHASKRIAQSILGSRPAAAIARQLRRGDRLVLAYHNVVESVDPRLPGDASLHLPLPSFREQLDCLREAGLSVVPLDAPAPSAGSPPEVVITFDDACAGAIRLGLPELSARAMPATVFVAPGLLGSPSPWWDRLSDPSTGEISPAIRDVALNELHGDGGRILTEASRLGWPVAPAHAAFRIATAEELDGALGAHASLRLGAHTWSHPNLARLTEREITDELARSLQWISTRWPGRVVRWIAYPYGKSLPNVHAAAGALGYDGALLIEGAWGGRTASRFASPRLNVTPRLSLDGFRARVAGLWPSWRA